MSAHVSFDTWQVPGERELGPGVPPAQPALGELQLPRVPGPPRALDPHDLRVRQQRAGEVRQLGTVPRTHRAEDDERVQQNSDAETRLWRGGQARACDQEWGAAYTGADGECLQ